MTTTILYIIIAVLVVIAIAVYMTSASRLQAAEHLRESALKQVDFLETELQQERELLGQTRVECSELRVKEARLTSQIDEAHRRASTQAEDRDALLLQFKDLSAQVMEQRAEQFDQAQRKSLHQLLEPLSHRISRFEQRVEKTSEDAVKRHAALREQVKQLTDINATMGEEAKRLTNALKADVREQGSWGEMILESILEKSGLEKGREYTVQDSHTTEDGKRYRTDVVITLPDDKRMIIDSKVSLKDFEEYVNASDDAQRDISLKAHGLSLRKHIDILAQKNYHDLYQIESPDFVLLFVPKDNAFAAALNYDSNLYQYAFDRNIVIVTPATLLATLKTVDTLWRNHKQNQYALEIASEAGKMYDKFVGFTDDLVKMGKQLDTVKNTYQDSMKKLSTGTGSLVTRAEKLKNLGAKANKKIASELRS